MPMFTISSGLPNRPVGLRASRSCFAASSLRSQSMSSGVSMGPGLMLLDRTPCPANWTASERVRARTAPFDAVEASCGTEHPRIATKLAMLMIDPEPCSSICGIAYLQPRNTPRTLTAMTRSQVATSVSMTEWSASGITPALLYSASTRPKVATACATMPRASSSFETSVFTNVASPPAFRTASTVALPASSTKSATTTLAPSRANSSAATRPMPLPPPVTMVTLPSSRMRAPLLLVSRVRVAIPGAAPSVAQRANAPCRDGMAHALQLEPLDRVRVHRVPDGGMGALRDEHLAVDGLAREPRGDDDRVPDGRVVVAALVADPPGGREARRDADPEAQVVAAAGPAGREPGDVLAHGDGHPHGAQRVVGLLDRVV